MKASTLFLATFTIWIVAKGRTKDYWKLATVSAPSGSPAGASASGSAVPPVSALPDIRTLTKQILDQSNQDTMIIKLDGS